MDFTEMSASEQIEVLESAGGYQRERLLKQLSNYEIHDLLTYNSSKDVENSLQMELAERKIDNNLQGFIANKHGKHKEFIYNEEKAKQYGKKGKKIGKVAGIAVDIAATGGVDLGLAGDLIGGASGYALGYVIGGAHDAECPYCAKMIGAFEYHKCPKHPTNSNNNSKENSPSLSKSKSKSQSEAKSDI